MRINNLSVEKLQWHLNVALKNNQSLLQQNKKLKDDLSLAKSTIDIIKNENNIFISNKIEQIKLDTKKSFEKDINKLISEKNLLQNKLDKAEETISSLTSQIDSIKHSLENIALDAVNKATKPLLDKIDVLEKDNARLKSILNSSSDNSGIPTSKTPINKDKRIPNSREKSEKLKGGQFGHKKHKLEKFNDDEITDTYIHEVFKCSCGCEELEDLGIRATKDLFDINIRLMKIRNEFHNYKCKSCGKIIESPIPLNLKEDNQYGNNAQALALSLVNDGYVSFKRTRELISGFTSGEMNMSEGFIAKLQKRCFQKLEKFDHELHQKIISLNVLNWDDTVIAIDKKNACLRFYGNDKYAYYKAHLKKDKDGIDKDSILNVISKETVVVHDHNKVNYNNEYDFTNAECCVHLIRDLKKVKMNLGHVWTDKLINLLIDTNNKRKEYIEENIGYFDQELTDKVNIEYDQIIELAKEENKKDFNKYFGSDEKTLINRLIDYKENYLLWVIRFDIPFSNNISERSLRGAKTKMKVSGQFANLQNAEYFARIKSYIETCRRHNVNPHNALARLIDDDPFSISELEKTLHNNEVFSRDLFSCCE